MKKDTKDLEECVFVGTLLKKYQRKKKVLQ